MLSPSADEVHDLHCVALGDDDRVVLKRGSFDAIVVAEGDEVEIVNFVGGGGEHQEFSID